MTTRNNCGISRPRRSALEQRIVGPELTRLLLEHHRHRVSDRVGESVQSADQHVRLTAVLQRSLAHRAGEYLEQSRFHQGGPPAVAVPRTLARTRVRSSCASCAVSCAVTGTYHNRELANERDFTASFSVMSTGRASANATCDAVRGW